MITLTGKLAIGDAVARSLGQYIAIGVGESPVVSTSTKLDFEVYRAPIRVRDFDRSSDTIFYAATIPDNLDTYISEVALIASSVSAPSAGILSAFDSTLESWNGGTWTSSDMRVNSSGLTVAATTATSGTSTLIRMPSVGQSDILDIAYYGTTGGNVEVRLMNGSSDYFSISFPVQSGYNVYSTPITSLVKTGAADLTAINTISVIHSGSGSITMDAIKVTAMSSDEKLLIRQRFTTLYRKISGQPLDVEIPLALGAM